MDWKKARAGAIVLLGLVLAAGGLWALEKGNGKDFLDVAFLDVGQGDATLLVHGDFAMLVDGGPDRSVEYALDAAMPFFDRQLDYVVATHPHDDHYFGLISLPERYEIGAAIVPPPSPKEPHGYAEFLKKYQEEGIPIIFSTQLREIAVGEELAIEFLFPFSAEEVLEEKNLNNISIVMKVSYGQTDLLLTGDTEEEAEESLLECCRAELASEVLKAGHHGSSTSSSQEFLGAVSPDLAVISVGEDNSFGHPSPRTTSRFERAGIRTLRTDQEGSIRLEIGPEGYHIAN